MPRDRLLSLLMLFAWLITISTIEFFQGGIEAVKAGLPFGLIMVLPVHHWCSGRELLFNLRRDKEERHSLLAEQRERAVAMRARLSRWTKQLQPPGLPSDRPNGQETRWYEHYFQATGQVPIK